MTRRGFLLAAASPTPASAGEYFQKGVTKNGIVGASLVVWHNGKVIVDERHGYQNLEKRQLVSPLTLYHWASITKTMTSIGILQLRDRGLLKLDDQMSKYCPEILAVKNSFGPMEAITIRHVLSHSSGFRAGTWLWPAAWDQTSPKAWQQLVAKLPETDILFAPGTKFSYSNLAILFLGRAIEELTGESFITYINKNIFEPLGMKTSYFNKTAPPMLANRAQSYYNEKGRLRSAPFDIDAGVTTSNSGLNAPLSDMVLYLASLAGQGQSILKRESLEEMWRPILPAEDKESIGLGFFITQRGPVKLAGHAGDQNAFISRVGIAPARRAAYAVAYNTNATGPLQNTKAFDIQLKEYLIDTVFARLS